MRVRFAVAFVGILTLLAAPMVSAQQDVTVSDTNNVVRNGTVNDITAYSFATTSCNIGNQVAIWVDNTNEHPLIGAQLYRLKDGRMEQIGMSWLKHSFCAVNENSCGNCQDTPCDTLGIGCADTYSTGLNGDQANLGPRSDVNAATGAYQYPFPTQGQTGDSIYKRLQVNNIDVDPDENPNADYYVEIVYLTTDEQPFGNQFNNTATRKVIVTGSEFNLAFDGPVQTETNIMDQWQAVDSDVVLETVDIPNDGRMILGYKVTDIGGGLYRYDYSLYNYNSDRCGQSFSIPIPAGVNVTDVTFNDVDYHSGEPYADTDWSSSIANGFITWETQTFSQNTNANALRWSTSYSFGFTADSAPQTAAAQVGLFKPGTPSSVSFITQGPESSVITANFVGSPTSGGSPLAVQFTSTSGGNIDTYEWDFGDGNVSDEINPLHIYTQQGLYTVSLTVTGPTGTDTATFADYIDVGAPVQIIALEDDDAFAGASAFTVPVLGSSPDFLGGYTMAAEYPEDLLDGVDFSLTGSVAEGLDTSFLQVQIDDGAGTITLEALFDTLGGNFIPPGDDQVIANMIFAVASSVTDGETRTIDFVDGLGAVPVNNRFFDNQGIELPPATIGNTITFFNQPTFVRGDCDGQDGLIQLPDALFVLNVVFLGAAPPDCLKACDFDDSGNLGLPDGLGMLFYTFAQGAPPPPPFPNPGPDPTPDSLPCF